MDFDMETRRKQTTTNSLFHPYCMGALLLHAHGNHKFNKENYYSNCDCALTYLMLYILCSKKLKLGRIAKFSKR
jgi:hypothetical protein